MNELSLFNTLFNQALDTVSDYDFGSTIPSSDVKQTKDSYFLEMDLPGFTEKDVNIELDNNILTISSYHKDLKEEKSGEKAKSTEKYLIRERMPKAFSRRFTLPEDINWEQISAVLKNGILSVKLPRKELTAPKKIAIEAA